MLCSWASTISLMSSGVATSDVLFAAVFAIGLLGEPLRTGLAVGTVLVAVGAAGLALAATPPVKFRSSAYRLGLAAALTSALVIGGRDAAVRWTGEGDEVSARLAAVLTLGTGALVMLGYLLYTSTQRGPSSPNGPLTRLRTAAAPFCLLGVAVGFGHLSIFEALERGRVTVVSPLVGTAALWTLVFSALLLGKSDAINKRVVASALLVAGGVALIGATRS